VTNPDAAWRAIKPRVVNQPTAQDRSEEQARRERETERRQLAEVQGVTIPVMPPRLPGEDDKTYGCRIAWIAKSHCGPPPRPKVAPKRMPKPLKVDLPPGEDSMVCHGERLAGMTADLTTEDEP
jgi:hypothetical protein